MNLLFLDLSPDYIPFLVQCTKAAGDVIDPTVDNLIIYEEGGANSTFDSTTITGSPFDPAKVNTKTGLWGVLIAKTAFTAGRYYIALWEMTVDGITTAKVEKYFACNASSFKADVSGLSTLDAAGVRTAVGLATANLDTQLADLPTVSEFNARTTTDPATATAVAAIPTTPLLAANYTAPDNAGITAIGNTLGVAGAGLTALGDTRLANLDAAVSDAATLTEIEASTVLAKEATLAALNDLSAADVNAEVVDVLRTDTIPDSYAVDGDQPTLAQAILAIHQMMMEKSIVNTTLTVKKPDGSTTAMTFTLNDATNPTSITRAS